MTDETVSVEAALPVPVSADTPLWTDADKLAMLTLNQRNLERDLYAAQLAVAMGQAAGVSVVEPEAQVRSLDAGLGVVRARRQALLDAGVTTPVVNASPADARRAARGLSS